MYFDYNGHLHDICVDRIVGTAAVLGLHLSKPLAVYQLYMNPKIWQKKIKIWLDMFFSPFFSLIWLLARICKPFLWQK